MSSSHALTYEVVEQSPEPHADVVIEVRGLGKCYQLYEKPIHRLLQSLIGGERRFYKEFWALRRIDFKVKRGQTLGIIGRNGSGKSTLLQILTGTLKPSEGSVSVKGRVAALLELGSGFNPDFTGRENVYLNASILGLTRQQTDQRLGDILAFADIGEFIDQPVRNYSSGMMMRLAFAVMAHVDADVLIIDEALAVGDAFFGQKCMRYLRAFKERGTLLFVSHDAAAVMALCDEALWLDSGRFKVLGPAKDVMKQYIELAMAERQGGGLRALSGARASANASDATKRRPRDPRRDLLDRSMLRNDIHIEPFHPDRCAGVGHFRLRVTDVSLLGDKGEALAWIIGGETVTLEISGVAHEEVNDIIVGFYFKDRLGQLLFGDNTYLTYMDEGGYSLKAGEEFRAHFTFEMPRLQAGDYFITVGVAEGSQDQHVIQHWIHEALSMSSHVPSGAPHGLIGLPMMHIGLERH